MLDGKIKLNLIGFKLPEHEPTTFKLNMGVDGDAAANSWTTQISYNLKQMVSLMRC